MLFELKEAIRGSMSFRLVEDPKLWPYIKLSFVSQGESNNSSSATAMVLSYDSEAMPMNGAFITTTVQTCGMQKVKECARGLLPDIDLAIGRLQKEAPELWRTLR